MKVVREINRGGFGVVREVKLPDGTHAACKFFDPHIGSPDEREKLRKRFQREVRIQSQITHPNIMPVLGYDLEASPPWFTMPLATQSFETKLVEDRANQTFDSEPWQDILAAVEELHRLGYVHRDLKPANILLVGAKWVVSDFGLILPTSRETTVLTRVEISVRNALVRCAGAGPGL
jgi:eukaryotic-like serine/threonine-protein kinase